MLKPAHLNIQTHKHILYNHIHMEVYRSVSKQNFCYRFQVMNLGVKSFKLKTVSSSFRKFQNIDIHWAIIISNLCYSGTFAQDKHDFKQNQKNWNGNGNKNRNISQMLCLRPNKK